MPWIRLEAAYFQNPNVVRAGWDGAVVFLAAMTMAKLHGWRGGVIPKEDFTPDLVRRHLGIAKSRHSDKRHEEALQSCIRARLLTEDATSYTVRSWGKFQADPTAAERKRRQRERENVTVSHGDVTMSRRRDGTGHDSTDPPQSPLEGGGSSPPAKRKFRPRDRQKLLNVLDAVISTYYRTQDERKRALDQRAAHQLGALSDEAITNLLETEWAWVVRKMADAKRRSA